MNEEIVSQLSFPVPLFFRPSFVYRNKTKAVHSFELKANVAQALAHFVLENGEAISLQAAPFGSVYGNEKCTLNILSDFIAHIKKSLAQKKIHTITVKHYPACYAPALHDIVLEAFLNNGFQLEYTEQNQYLPLDALSSKDVFDHSKLHLIKKCKEAGFTVHVSSTFDPIVWFELIRKARKLRGHPLTIDLEGLKLLNKYNEEEYHFFEVRKDDKIACCAVGVQVTPDVLYYYLAADDEEYRKYSPMTYLLDRMYSFALERGVKVLDMGISSSNGILNDGLFWFKKSFGSLSQPKYILKCSLSGKELIGGKR